MKNFKMIFLVLVVFLLSSGCDLEEKIYDTATADLFIQKESDIRAMLNGLYSDLQSYGGFKSNMNYQLMYSSDDLATASNPYREFLERTISATNAYHQSSWQSFYSVINNTNSLIQSLQQLEWVDEAYKNRVLGECYFMRAFSYFYLVRLYGGVPLKTESTGGKSDFYLPRNSIEEVYARIFADFTIACENCILFSNQPSDESGHATKGAAQAMLSLAYLTYGNHLDLQSQAGEAAKYYQLAENFADSVILSNQYSLVPNYADLWDVSKEKAAYNEVVFCIQFTRDATATGAISKGSEWAYYFQPQFRYYVTGYPAPSPGRGLGAIYVQPWFYDYYHTGDYEGDYRSEVSFITRYQYQDKVRNCITYPEIRTKKDDYVSQYPFINKYKDPDGYDSRNHENDLYVIRLSEVYLIKAEAENEINGPTGDAYTAFNNVRERARNANGTVRTTPADLSPGLSKEEFRMKIFDERGLEFLAEEHRWFDSIRMKYKDNTRPMIQYLYEDFLPSLVKEAPKYNTTTEKWEGGRVQPLNIVSWTPKFLVWPIPSTEIDTNPNIKQSPVW
jgi:hypothetical protein